MLFLKRIICEYLNLMLVEVGLWIIVVSGMFDVIIDMFEFLIKLRGFWWDLFILCMVIM